MRTSVYWMLLSITLSLFILWHVSFIKDVTIEDTNVFSAAIFTAWIMVWSQQEYVKGY